MSRFSKQTLTETLQEDIDDIQNEWGFDITNGTVQIEPIALDRMKTNPLLGLREDSRDAAAHKRQAYLDYGRLQALESLAEEFSLAVSYVPVSHGTRRKVGRFPQVIRYVSDAQAQAALDYARAERAKS